MNPITRAIRWFVRSFTAQDGANQAERLPLPDASVFQSYLFDGADRVIRNIWETDAVIMVALITKLENPPKDATIDHFFGVAAATLPLTGRHFVGLGANAKDLVFPYVRHQDVITGILICTAHMPLAWITGPGLPITTNGGDIQIWWDRGPNKICRVATPPMKAGALPLPEVPL